MKIKHKNIGCAYVVRVFTKNAVGMLQFYMVYKDREDEIVQSGIGQFG